MERTAGLGDPTLQCQEPHPSKRSEQSREQQCHSHLLKRVVVGSSIERSSVPRDDDRVEHRLHKADRNAELEGV
jgi:hypothetical protein